MDLSKLNDLYSLKAKKALANDKNAANRTEADVNGDGKINKADKEIIQKQINELRSDKAALYNINGDDKFDYMDYISLTRQAKQDDANGDGVVDDKDKQFSEFLQNEAQKLLKELLVDADKNKNNIKLDDYINFQKNQAEFKFTDEEKEALKALESKMYKYATDSADDDKVKDFDLNKDGKVNMADYNQFLKSIEGLELDKHAKKKLDAFGSKLGLKSFDSNDNGALGFGDLGRLAKKSNDAKSFIEKHGNDAKFTKAQLKKYDINNDGKIDQTDIDLMDQGVSDLMKYLGVSDFDGDGKLSVSDMEAINKSRENEKDSKAKVKELNSQLKIAKKYENKYNKDVKPHEDAVNNAKTALQEVNDAIDKLHEDFQNGKIKASEYYSKIDELNKTQNECEKKLKKAENKLKKAQAEFNKTDEAKAFKKLKLDIPEGKTPTEYLNSELEKAEKEKTEASAYREKLTGRLANKDKFDTRLGYFFDAYKK